MLYLLLKGLLSYPPTVLTTIASSLHLPFSLTMLPDCPTRGAASALAAAGYYERWWTVQLDVPGKAYSTEERRAF